MKKMRLVTKLRTDGIIS